MSERTSPPVVPRRDDAHDPAGMSPEPNGVTGEPSIRVERRPATTVAGGTRPAALDGRGDGSAAAIAVLQEEPVAADERPPLPLAAPVRQLPRLTWEGLAYLFLIGAAIVTRFWDLGTRALHHDESLHAYYSWQYAVGDGYVHNPLMHGPFLFHANALVYSLLGASDASSRYMPALFGVILVGLPYLLRGERFLGHFGALAASALFLISPSFLYYSRYIRHDLYTVVGTLVLFICLVRQIERPQRRWIVGAAASLSFLFTNHEIVFAIVAVFAGFLWGALLWGRLRPLLSVQIGALALAGAVWLAFPGLGQRWGIDFAEPLPAIPWQGNPTREMQRAYWEALLTHPLVLGLAAVALLFVLACAWVLWAGRRRGPILADAPAGTVEAAVRAAGRDWTGLALAAFAFVAIFVVLFTSLFTNREGLASGTVATDGTLLYWLGQQDVQRGSQPWFYFLYLTPQYEFFVVAFGLAAVAVTLGRAFLKWRDPKRVDPSLFARLWLVVWFGAIFVGLSYAGEKMPWLIVHFSLPGTLLAGALIGEIAERWMAVHRARRNAPVEPDPTPATRLAGPWVGPGLAAGLLLLAGGWWFLTADLTHGEFVRPEGGNWQRVVTADALDRWWVLALAPAAALGLLYVVWAARGRGYAGRWATVAMIALLALLQFHQAWRLSYLEGDTPRDSLIYNTTSPDVTRMVRELALLSEAVTGGDELVIWYDSGQDGVAWPLNWYLRDFPNRVSRASLNEPPRDAAVVIVSNRHTSQWEPQLRAYTPTAYVLRWHEPEYDLYRNFAIAPELPAGRSALKQEGDPDDIGAVLGSVGDSLATQLEPAGQARVWRIWLFRELPGTTMHFDYTVYVRTDLLPVLNEIRY